MKKILFSLLSIFLLSQCSGTRATTQAKPQEKELSTHAKSIFTLTTKEGLYLSNVNLKIRFYGVTQDSRCPKDAKCIWAGNARVALKANDKAFTLDTQNLASNDLHRSKFIDGFTYTLVHLSPEKKEGLKDWQYTLKLKIEKGNHL